MLTENSESNGTKNEMCFEFADPKEWEVLSRSVISTAELHTLPCVDLRPIKLVICQRPYQWGRLILGAASRLDAFSASPFWT
jgi:hypothetical protein